MVKFFDALENIIRGWLARRPIIYALIAGTGVVIFWRGIWHTMDYLMSIFIEWRAEGIIDFTLGIWWDGPLSILIGCVILLLCGAFVSTFIGNEVILSGLRGEKKLSEKTERELRYEAAAIAHIKQGIEDIHKYIKKHKS